MKKRLFSLLTIVLISSLLVCSCADLGDFEDEEEYYDTFGSFTIVSSGDIKTCDVEDLYSKATTETFATPFEENTYRYAVVQVKENRNIRGIALWMKSSTTTADVKVTLYVLNQFVPESLVGEDYDLFRGQYQLNNANLQNIDERFKENTSLSFDGKGTLHNQDNVMRPYSTSNTNKASFTLGSLSYAVSLSQDYTTLTATITDKLNGGTEILTYNFVPGSDASSSEVGMMEIGNSTVHLIPNSWNSFLIESFTIGNSALKSFTITEGQYLCIKFENNGVGAQRKGLNPASFTVTNLMVRS